MHNSEKKSHNFVFNGTNIILTGHYLDFGSNSIIRDIKFNNMGTRLAVSESDGSLYIASSCSASSSSICPTCPVIGRCNYCSRNYEDDEADGVCPTSNYLIN